VWLQESPGADGQTGAYGIAASKPFRLQRAPIARTNVFISAPPGINQATVSTSAMVSYNVLFDPPAPLTNPVTAPVIVDGGAGNIVQGTYRVVYSYVTPAGEVGMSPPSNALVIQPNRLITVQAVPGVPTGVTSLNLYLITSPQSGPPVGLLGNTLVTNGVSAPFTFNATGGNDVLPALLISDTGELFFPEAPISGPVSLSYQTSRFSDIQVLDALHEGLDMLWPEIWTPQPVDTTSVQPSPIQWEYALPIAQYGDPRTVIMEVETMPPSAFVIFTRLSNWRFLNDSNIPTLIFAKPPPVGGTVRITYAVPFATLAQVPSIAQMLPVYYAIARLMSDQEVMRGRADDQPALTGENAGAEKGGALQTAGWWMQNMFAPALQKLSLGFPARHSIMTRVAEKLNLSPLWTGMQ
jgi:hypothetical protein